MTGTITMRLFGLITALAITVSLLNPASAAELQLLPRIVVDGDVITLGHLFGDMGEAGEIVVARSPEPGKRITITVASIHRAVRDQGLAWMPLRGLKRITVNRPGRRIPNFEIETAIRHALAGDIRGDGLSITLANRNQALFVATDAAPGLEVENISYDARTGRFAASLVAAAGTVHETRAEFSGRAIETVELPVLSRAMKKGEIIGDGDIEWLDWQAKRIPRDAITDVADLVGQAARRSLRPDVPLRARDVGEPIVVAKGSAVRLVYRTPIMVLTAGGRALEDGAMGAIIRIRNSKTKVVVEARVDSPNILIVTGSTFLALN